MSGISGMSVISDAIERLRALLFRRREERELAEELRFHVDMETRKLEQAGVSHAEARRRGLLALGGIEQVKEEVRDARGTRLVEDSAGDFAFALRTLSRSPGFAIVAILTLAVGIGGTTAVFSAVDAVLLQPLPYQQAGQLVRLYQTHVAHPDARTFVTPVHFLDYRSRLSSLDALAGVMNYNESGADIGSGAAVRRIRILAVSADYFDVLRVHPELGRPFQRDEENAAPVVIVSHELWQQQLGGDPTALGRPLMMNGKAYLVTGVLPAGFRDPMSGVIDAWIPADLTPGREVSNAGNHYISVIARLRPGVTIGSAQAELDVLSLALAKQYPEAKATRARLYPLKDDIVGSSSRALVLMLGAVGLVLLLVCVNIANLMLVRGAERAREFALRSALGAERSRLVRQMLIESLTLALVGDVAGLVVARLLMSAIVILGAGSIPRLATLSLDPRLLLFSLAIASLCAVGFGLAPALRAARTQPSDVLREQSRSATGGPAQMRLREWLVVSQVALAFVLLVGAGLLIASVQAIRRVDLGVKPDGVLTFELHLPDVRYDSTARAAFYDQFAKRVEAIPGVTAAGGISRLPAAGQFNQWGTTATSGPLGRTDRADAGSPEQRVVAGDYFRAVGIPLLEGRLFDARDDATAPHRVLITKTLAERLFPGVSPLGQSLVAGGRSAEVIGIVGDVSIDAEGSPDDYVYHAHAQFAGDRNWALTQVVKTTGSLDGVRSDVARLLGSIDPQLVMYRPVSLTEAIGRSEAQRVFTLRILATFAGVALTLSALGLFGVLSYGVRLRTREFGIRMALGAETGAIRRMVLRQGLTVVAVGIVIGLGGALALSRTMSSMVFHVSPLDPLVLLGAMVFMAVVGGLAAYLPAHRATVVDPRSALQ